ncbi:MAG: hypothetical protein AABY32_02760 [Nanoarchaeota archaeon]
MKEELILKRESKDDEDLNTDIKKITNKFRLKKNALEDKEIREIVLLAFLRKINSSLAWLLGITITLIILSLILWLSVLIK